MAIGIQFACTRAIARKLVYVNAYRNVPDPAAAAAAAHAELLSSQCRRHSHCAAALQHARDHYHVIDTLSPSQALANSNSESNSNAATGSPRRQGSCGACDHAPGKIKIGEVAAAARVSEGNLKRLNS